MKTIINHLLKHPALIFSMIVLMIFGIGMIHDGFFWGGMAGLFAVVVILVASYVNGRKIELREKKQKAVKDYGCSVTAPPMDFQCAGPVRTWPEEMYIKDGKLYIDGLHCGDVVSQDKYSIFVKCNEFYPNASNMIISLK